MYHGLVSTVSAVWFLSERTNGRAIGTVFMLRPSVAVVCLSVCDVMYRG